MSQSTVPQPAPSAPVPEGAIAAPRAAWHGTASVWGSVLGVIMTAIAMGLPGRLGISPFTVVWAMGLVLLLVRGRARRFGVGLVASGLVVPTMMVWSRVQDVMWIHP
jgi:hypothetical protein